MMTEAHTPPEQPRVLERLPEQPRVAVIVNPGSTRANAGYKQITRMMDAGYLTRGCIYHTEPGGLEANADGLLKLFVTGPPRENPDEPRKRYDAVVVLGGDGTLDLTVNFLQNHPDLPEDIRDTPIIAAGGGGANDGHRSFFGRLWQRLHLGKLGGLPIVNLLPLDIITAAPNGEVKKRKAALYASIGLTALIAAKINSDEHRNSRLRQTYPGRKLRELGVGLTSLAQSRPFTIIQDRERRKAHEVLASNNGRMGGVEGWPGDPTSKTFSTVELRRRRGLLLMATRVLTKQALGQEGHKSINFTVESPDGTPIPMQANGETELLDSGTEVTMEQSADKVPVVAPRLAARLSKKQLSRAV